MAVNVNIITRELKGAPLTTEELDLNFLNLKEGVESSSPPGFNFNYNATDDILSIDNTVSGGDLDLVQLFPSLGNNVLTIGTPQTGYSQIESQGSFVINKHLTNQGYNTEDIFIIKTNSEELFKVRQDGVFIFKALDDTPANVPQATGGFYYDGENFWTQEGV